MVRARTELVEERRATLRPAQSGFPAGRCENQLKLHPFFGYTWNPHVAPNNNHGFRNAPNFLTTPTGLALEGIDRTKHLVIGIFGGSVAWLVSDQAETIANVLRPHIAPLEPLVIDFAFGGHAMPQQFFIFSTYIDLIDVAVFLDGGNEIWNSFDNNRHGCPAEYAKAHHYQFMISRQELSPHTFDLTSQLLTNRRLSELVTRLSLLPGLNRSRIVHRLWERTVGKLSAGADQLEAQLGSAATRSGAATALTPIELTTFASKRWELWHSHAEQIARARGMLALHLLQPTPFLDGGRTLTAEERELIKWYDCELSELMPNGYPKLVAAAARLAQQGMRAKSMQHIFAGIESAVWLDPWHPNRDCTALLAAAVAEELLEALVTFRGNGRLLRSAQLAELSRQT